MMTFNSRHELDTIDVTHAKGLTFSFFPHGGLFRATCGNILLNQVLGSPVESALNNVYLRIKTSRPIQFIPLVGPASSSTFAYGDGIAVWQGQWEALAYTCTLTLHPEDTLWFWTVEVCNLGAADCVCDVIYAQDIGLAPEGVVRLNEAYCSHYLDHHVFTHAQYGFVVCTRQNQAFDAQNPWLMQGCTARTTGYVTDGLSFYGLSYKEDNIPYALTQERLASEKKQYEMAFCGLQTDDITLVPGAPQSVTFYATYVPHHPEPTQAADEQRIDDAVARVAQAQGTGQHRSLTEPDAVPTVFHDLTLLTGHELTDDDVHTLFPATRRHEEYAGETLLSFFYGDATHVVLQAKERYVERPHGHILRSGSALVPHDDIMSSTTYMYGVFHAHVTMGNTSFNKLLSITRTPLNILKSSGQRIFVRRGDRYELLGMPSCYEIGLQACRWIYKTDDGWITVTSWMSAQEPVAWLRMESTTAQTFAILSNIVLGNNELDHRGHLEIDVSTATVTLTPHQETDMKARYPEAVFYITTAERDKVQEMGADAWLYADHQSRGLAYLTIQTKPVHTFSLAMTGSVLNANEAQMRCRKYQTQPPVFERDQESARAFWQGVGKHFKLTLHQDHHFVHKMNDLFYWYVHNAMVHLSVPHGLEQYNGAAWGVRDVCQGPVEWLLATRHHDAVKSILFKVFAQQYEDTSDWPQWFMFDRFVHIQHPESHGDIIVWPLKALALYLEATNDLSILEAEVPYTNKHGFVLTQQQETLLRHVQRTIDTIEARFIPGTALSCYGAGDWNDTLQPAESAMRERMVSAWTVSLTYQVFRQLANAFEQAGLQHERERVRTLAQRIKDDFNRHLIKDGVVSGFGYVHADGRVEHLLHPSDRRTGIQYRLLPMTRSIISELFSPAQALDHLRLIDEHLTCADGVRLMNQPVPYRGGVRVFFRRAEESAYFGREVGLQYVHAHIRYIEAMCKMGHATRAYQALLQIIPIGLQEHVPNAMPRQSNAYFSSSDADVKDRYEAEQLFTALRAGNLPVKGGWRIYSSGPGIFMNQVLTNFLGLRDYYDDIVIDPVLPKLLDGLQYASEAEGQSVTYIFSVAHNERALVQSVAVNGRDVVFTRQDNPYRHGGAMIRRADFHALLSSEANVVSVSLS